jgi:SAM-dependent methyltransferase
VSLRDAWDSHAEEWTAWARTPGHDSYWRFHRRRFLDLLPPPGRLTVDIGAGEGRVGRDLQELGHSVVALDASPKLARACARHPGAQLTVLADAAALPVRSGVADLAVAFMSLHDIDGYEEAIAEAARVLVTGGRLCLALVHPINSGGKFEGERSVDNPFVIRGSYLTPFRYADSLERDGLTMTFHSFHRPLEAYSRALDSAGFLIEAIREVTDDDPADRWHRIPLFLHLRAVRVSGDTGSSAGK